MHAPPRARALNGADADAPHRDVDDDDDDDVDGTRVAFHI